MGGRDTPSPLTPPSPAYEASILNPLHYKFLATPLTVLTYCLVNQEVFCNGIAVFQFCHVFAGVRFGKCHETPHHSHVTEIAASGGEDVSGCHNCPRYTPVGRPQNLIMLHTSSM